MDYRRELRAGHAAGDGGVGASLRISEWGPSQGSASEGRDAEHGDAHWPEAARRVGGLLQLKPWDLWRHTPKELAAAIAAYGDRHEAQAKRDAWYLANLLQPWSKERLKLTDFYTPRQVSPMQAEQDYQQFRRLAKGSNPPDG